MTACASVRPASWVDLTGANLISAVLPDGRAAEEGKDYYFWFGERGTTGLVIPLGTEVWLLIESSRADSRRRLDYKSFYAVNAVASDPSIEIDFCGPWYREGVQPPCSALVPAAVYQAVIALAPENDRQRWLAEEQRLAADRRKKELAAAQSEANKLRVRAAQLRGRCLGASAIVDGFRARLDCIACTDLSDADVTQLGEWNAATDVELAAIEPAVLRAEEEELAPIRQTVKDIIAARRVYGLVQNALTAARGDLKRAQRSLQSEYEQNRNMPMGQDLAPAIAFVKAQLARSQTSPAISIAPTVTIGSASCFAGN